MSSTSVSRRAGPPQPGQVVCTKPGTVASGDRPVPAGRKSSMSGSTTGSSDSGTGCSPQASQYTIGIGEPQ